MTKSMTFIDDIHYQFAQNFGSEALQPFAYLISRQLQEGHICLELSEASLRKQFETLPDYIKNESTSLNEEEILGLEQWVSTDINVKRPFIVFNHTLYLYRYFNYETQIIKCIRQFVQTGNEQIEARKNELSLIKDFIRNFNSPLSNLREGTPLEELVDWQLVATLMAYVNHFSIVTGGPGTGKTTTIAKILSVIYEKNPDCRVVLAAPTGKAAMRVLESLKANDHISDNLRNNLGKLESKTIHRLLGYIHNSPYFKHNGDNFLDYDVVIIDEASMIDVTLFAKLISAVNPEKRLILIGDKNQLASVEAGSLFGDLCNSLNLINSKSPSWIEFVNGFISDNATKVSNHFAAENRDKLLFNHAVELKYNHRVVGEGEKIVRLSKAIINSDVAAVDGLIAECGSGAVKFDDLYSSDIFNEFIEGYKNYIDEPDISMAITKLNGLRVLCAVKDGDKGLHKTNLRIERYLNKLKHINSFHDMYENRPIIVTKNYHDLDLYNGDVGIVRKDALGVYRAYFLNNKNELRSVLPGLIPEVETVFAMTIHKSQGSEYNKVLVMLPDNADNPLLTRELLYTAITRAKTEVVIQASSAVIQATVNRFVERASGISKRIND